MKRTKDKMMFSTYHLGRAILYGIVFFSLWFNDSGIEKITDLNTKLSFGIILIFIYCFFGSLFLDGMKNMMKYEKVPIVNQRGTKK